MKKKLICLICSISATILLCSCGKDPAITQLKNDVDEFCTNISNIDSAINNIDAESENAISELLANLDNLNEEFVGFAELDFPEEFDYLESLADEASSYMTEAVDSYHDVYSDGAYNEYTAEYAKENYSRAYKRIQIIIAFLHGEDPEDMGLTVVETEE